MARNTSVTLGEHFSQFVDEQIKDGRFSNVSEVVRAGLRLLEDSETKQRALRAALLAGEASGPAVPLDWDEFLARKRAEHRDVTEVVPFLAVADMRASLAFYVDGLGFSDGGQVGRRGRVALVPVAPGRCVAHVAAVSHQRP